ncbi:MAG: protein adenylyltransferase SelO [Rhodoferax sp.]
MPPEVFSARVHSPPLQAGTAPATWAPGYAELGGDFVTTVSLSPLPAPYWVGCSDALGHQLGLDPRWQSSEHMLQLFSGNSLAPGGTQTASVYSGHQFGVWAGQLGDGRACSLGELGGQEVQLKGAGPTPYSRRGDGRAVLRSSIREFLCSEAMHALGIPSTRALCVTGSDTPVWREDRETAAVVTRVAPCFVRFGHFEHFSHHALHPQLKVLADYVIDRFYPECRSAATEGAEPYVALLAAVTARTAEMVAHWQSVGFCHGVMNTDNMSILGLTLDYGPFQFLDGYDPTHICNHSDSQGRYAFYKQPNVAYWNLFCLGQALLPLIGEQEHAIAALETYKSLYPAALAARMAAKLGFVSAHENQRPLIETILKLLAQEKVDFTVFWRRLSHWAAEMDLNDPQVLDLFVDRDAAGQWLAAYRTLHVQSAGETAGTASARMMRTNPKYVLRNHLGELAIRAAKEKDFSVLRQLHAVLADPFAEHPAHDSWAGFAPEWARSIEISCSS